MAKQSGDGSSKPAAIFIAAGLIILIIITGTISYVSIYNERINIVSNMTSIIISLAVTGFFSLVVLIWTWHLLKQIRWSAKMERKANELTKTILDSLPTLIEIWNKDFELMNCSQRTLELFGLSNADEYWVRYYEFSPLFQPCGTLSSELNKYYLEKVWTEGVIQFEWMRQLADKTPVPVEVVLTKVEINSRPMILGYIHDLREIKHAMSETREADERAALMMDTLPISCFMVRLDNAQNGRAELKPIDFNQAALDLFGFSSRNEVFEKFHDIFPHPPEGSVVDVVYALGKVALYAGFSKFEYTLKNLNGALIPCDVTFVRVEYQGVPTLICFQNDLRPHINKIEAEKYAHATTQMFLDAAPFFIEIWDKNLNLMDCNKSVLEIFGLKSRRDFIKNYFALCPEYQPCGTLSTIKIRNLLNDCLKNGTSRSEWIHTTLDGERLSVDVVYVRLKRGDEDILVGYSHDLRQIKTAIAEKIKAREENQAKTQFLARMSHELRTPMNSVLGITEIELQKKIHTPETEDAFKRIFNASKFLLTIINDILDLSKVQAGKIEIIPKVYHMAELIADTVQLNLMVMRTKHIKFTLEVNENLPVSLVGDELRVKQVLNNLLSNAFKYTPEGEVILKFDMDGDVGTGNFALVIIVSDTGQGMDANQIDTLFGAEFVRFNLDQNREVEGSGLGMAITHSLVKMMDGSIQVDSVPGKGSTFTVRIPQRSNDRQILGKEMSEGLRNFEFDYPNAFAYRSHEPMPYGRVLVVDDVESNLYVMKGYLQSYKVRIETVESGFDAIDRVKRGRIYDVIFMDHMMPDMDGIETTKKLRSMDYDAPIIALTANATAGIAQMFINNGFSDFISKPIDPNHLDACLMKYIFEKQSPEVVAAARKQHGENIAISDITGELRASFLMDANKSISILESIMQMQTLSVGAFKMYTIQTHGMKSALANIGQSSLAEAAKVLEDAGRNEDGNTIRNRTPHFLKLLKDVVHSHQLISGGADKRYELTDDVPDIVEDPVSIKKQWLAISVACEAYDTQEAKCLLRTLKNTPLSKKTITLIETIERHLLLSDDDKAALVAKQAAAEIIEKQGG